MTDIDAIMRIQGAISSHDSWNDPRAALLRVQAILLDHAINKEYDEKEKRMIDKTKLPKVADNRFWRVLPNPKSETKPVRVELRQRQVNAQTNFSAELIGWGLTDGVEDHIYAKADEINVRTGNIDKLIGDYDGNS